MIFEALSCITQELNDFFKNKLKINEDNKIVLSAIVGQDGNVAMPGENKIIVTLINIEKEPGAKGVAGGRTLSNSSTPLNINLYVLFSAYFANGNYEGALKLLSAVIAFLQDKSVFSRSNTPGLDDSIEKLTVEMESVSSEKLNNIWATLGAKYMPSALYKVRMLTFDSLNVSEYRPTIRASGPVMGGSNVPPIPDIPAPQTQNNNAEPVQ